MIGLGFVLRSLNQTELSLQAAREANELTKAQQAASRQAERPFVVVKPELPDLKQWLEGGVNKYQWRYRLHNVGLTPAIVEKVTVRTFIAPFEDYVHYSVFGDKWDTVPEIPEFFPSNPPRFIAATSMSDAVVSDWSQPLPDEQMRRIIVMEDLANNLGYRLRLQQDLTRHSRIIWLAGLVLYKDVWGNETYETHCYYTATPKIIDADTVEWSFEEVGGSQRNYST